jgi:LuxR family transcriptional regulator, maltose regulon positive regulatory protein
MPSASLARAKIQTPRFRSGLIERSELEEQLGDALTSRRLVLLVAPSGYGKTAALSRQVQRLPPGSAVAWLTTDEDDDLQRLLSHLIEALEPLDLPWRLAPEALLEPGRSRPIGATQPAPHRTPHEVAPRDSGLKLGSSRLRGLGECRLAL